MRWRNATFGSDASMTNTDRATGRACDCSHCRHAAAVTMICDDCCHYAHDYCADCGSCPCGGRFGCLARARCDRVRASDHGGLLSDHGDLHGGEVHYKEHCNTAIQWYERAYRSAHLGIQRGQGWAESCGIQVQHER